MTSALCPSRGPFKLVFVNFPSLFQGLLYFNSKLKILERRQQQVRELRGKHQVLLEELEDTKVRLMMDPSKWLGECKQGLLLLYCFFTSKPITNLFCD